MSLSKTKFSLQEFLDSPDIGDRTELGRVCELDILEKEC